MKHPHNNITNNYNVRMQGLCAFDLGCYFHPSFAQAQWTKWAPTRHQIKVAGDVEMGCWMWRMALKLLCIAGFAFLHFFFFWKKGRNPSRAWCQPLRHALLSMMPGLAVFTVLLSSFAWSPTLVITSCLTDTGLCLKSFSLSFQFGVGCLFVFWTLGFLPLSFTFQQSLPNYIRFF